jgi:hypothetical protein
MLSPTPELKAAQEQARVEVAPLNPGSPIVKPAWQTMNFWVSLGGILMALSSQVPEIVALLPAGSKARSWLVIGGIVAGCIGSQLSQKAGVTAATDVHAAMSNPIVISPGEEE